MRRPFAHAAAAVVLSVLVAGCGGDDGDDPGTSQSSDEPGEEPSEPDGEAEPAGAPCTVISDEQLTQITGSEQRVSGPRQEGTSERCETVRDADDGLEVTWTFREPFMSFAELVEYESDPGLVQKRLELGGAPAVLMTGEYVGEQAARLLVEVDEGQLVVEAKDSGLGEQLPEAELTRVAIEIAAAYAG
ncbi:DUF3558 domain-containing protein [Nocardioides sp. cx-169]|uniref:DUF3558 family protein n=1 Tax=Nocardioides sp. cx-169 TaxID=2899080 RepID=UPI001E578AA6|nr:DUF3558 family protein [Nocardioides sp. cx-169]MCD4533200.1 DUF3558 domain-containing protein [Nocardioides sp. cx-169]